MTPARRLLLIHAHPDDESITTGATMARYAAQGVAVTLLTCTLGEEGEVLVPALSQLAADQADQLGGYRIGELASAMRTLGISDHRFLGGPGRFRDSGMMGVPANGHPRALWRAAEDADVFAAAVVAAVEVVREVRPQVTVTYDPNGDYGHPDHIMAHRVATAAVEAAADPGYPGVRGEPWSVAKLYWTTLPRSEVVRAYEVMRAAGSSFFAAERVEDVTMGIDDDLVTTAVDGGAFGDVKMMALAQHATQVTVDGPFFALADNVGRKAMGIEYYRLAKGELGPDRDARGHESDLFSGVADDVTG
jgi:N-acetyl-1-D-myo-inositol-2-amino-2-deoxy-alpha-D-glucopyranoside deacetylase